MLLPWFSRALALWLLLTTWTVRAINEEASQLWTLVGCDGVDLDAIATNAASLAQAAIDAIDGIVGTMVPYNDGSRQWFNARNAYLFFGTDFQEVDEDHIVFTGSALVSLDKARTYYEGLIDALANGYWKPDSSWVFCKPSQEPYPFVKAVYAKDYVNFLSEAEENDLLSEYTDRDIVYYPDAGFVTAGDATGDLSIGRRRVGMYSADPNVCAATQHGSTGRVSAFVQHSNLDRSTSWMALCDRFYQHPDTVSTNIPADANNIDPFQAKSSVFLHELMHFRYQEVIDVKTQLDGMSEPDYFYGMVATAGLAGMSDGGNSDLALQNSDNFNMFALASYLPPRRWDIVANS